MIEVKKISGSKLYAIYEDGIMIPGSKGEKKKVTRRAAEMAGMGYKDYLRLKKDA